MRQVPSRWKPKHSRRPAPRYAQRAGRVEDFRAAILQEARGGQVIRMILIGHADRGDAPGVFQRGVDGHVVGLDRQRGAMAVHLHRAREFAQSLLELLAPAGTFRGRALRPESGLRPDARVEPTAAIEAALRSES